MGETEGKADIAWRGETVRNGIDKLGVTLPADFDSQVSLCPGCCSRKDDSRDEEGGYEVRLHAVNQNALKKVLIAPRYSSN